MASITLSQTGLKNARRVVIKIGSALLVDRLTGALRQDWLQSLADDVAALRKRGIDVVLVSSGSIALGRGVLGLGLGQLPLEQAQAAAATGQIGLAAAYTLALGRHDIKVGQVLVTLEDSADRRRYLNSRATLETLLGFGVVPIVNENDTIATDEIRYGDNDRFAAQGALMYPIQGLENGAPATWFLAKGDPQTARKGWIGSMKPQGKLMLDGGAVGALRQGKSLLPAGVRTVEGRFGRGDPVELIGPNSEVLAQGLTRYTSDETRLIAGHRSDEIEALLGYTGRAALVHRDDLALLAVEVER